MIFLSIISPPGHGTFQQHTQKFIEDKIVFGELMIYTQPEIFANQIKFHYKVNIFEVIMKSHLIMNCVVMCAFACPVMVSSPVFGQIYPTEYNAALEAKNTELFEPTVQFIKNHPEQVTADEFYLYAGEYVVWIANGPDAVAFRPRDKKHRLPPMIMTSRMQNRIWDAYKDWLPNYNKPPEKEFEDEVPR